MSSYYEKILATGEVKCIDEEIPFEVPKGWEWCRICHVAEIARGGSPRPIKEYLTDATDGINWIKIGDTEKDSKYITSVKERIKQSGVSKSRMVHKGDFLLTNSMSFGRPYITQVDGCIHDGWLVISLIEQSYRQDFFYYLLSSGYAYSQFAKRVAGAVVQNLNSEKVAISLFPLPPYKEQNRIVQKIKDLLPLVEKFGNDKTLLDKLNADINTRLKKSILQEAIQGKLVPQITEEGTAQELLEQIKKEKQKLVKEGKLKKSALNDSVVFRGDDNKYYEKVGKKIVCIEDEVPFEIPNSWVWVRLCAIVDFSKSQTISSSMLDMDSWILDLEDIEKDSGRLLQKKRMKELLSKSDKHLFYKGNVLYSKLRPYLNKVIVADEDGACTTEILAFDFGHIYNKYAQAYLMSPFFVDYANSDSYGIKMPRLGSKKGNNALFPIPPLREQQRIVEKIEQLMQLLK